MNLQHAASHNLWGAIWTLIRTDFKARYHGMVFGFFWALLKPLAIAMVLIGVFSFIFADDSNYGSHLVIGIVLYDFFNETTKTGMLALLSKSYIVGKTNFPRWILVATSAATPLLTVLVASTAIIAFLTIFRTAPSAVGILLFLGYLTAFLLINIAFSLAASVLMLRYRDLNQIWEVITQAGFFFAPVIYPLKVLPERFHGYLYLWIPTPVMQFSRAVLVDGETPTLTAHLLLLGCVVLALICGTLLHRRLVPRAAEYL